VKFADVSAETTDREGVFTLEIALRAGPASEDEIRQALDGSNRYIDTQEGVFLLAPDLMERLLNVQKALSGQYKRPLMPRIKRRLRSRELADAEALLEEVAQPIIPTGAWGQRSGALRSVGRLTPAPVRASLDDRLRGYQRIGVAWMWHLYRHDLCGILADEMGLGKTVQALALIACACDRAEGNEPSLIICPAGLIENWRREAAAFAPWLKVFTHHRERRLRDPALFPQYDLIITSYATLVRDLDLFKSAPLSVVVADEAQHIKNRRSQSAKALRSLAAPQRFVLTGTPVENSLDDLRSLFEFLMPGLLEHIPSRCGRDERVWYDQRHRKKAAPYILRRNKQLVAPELPEKIEQVIFCRMEEVQRKLYEDLKTATQRQINDMEMAGNSENKIRFAVLTRLLRLRQACVDPRLVDPACVAARGAKLDALAEIVDEAMDGGHRILLFSQFVSALTIIREEFEGKGVPYAYLDGKTQDRSGVCDHFNSEPSIPVFLISLKAGGTGLNLTGADTVVHFDPWWNPAVEAQATDRAHRIGQTRIVTSIKLIVADSVEEKVLAMQRRKADILRDLLDESAVATAKVSLEDIKDLLS
jgi:SNF2 family DNA or RNA helicase